ncbi:ABC transporter permease [Agromyces silvae]|uniref:ABC transporter permease n=1 Tax=Agromyces silvae TaxID=3388266 RepID=UPI00280ABA0C|nr:ABC transporter permease [Agromyces protaetiae]
MSSTALSVVKAEVRLFSREPGYVFWIIGFPAVLVIVLGLVPVLREPIDGIGVSFLTIYVPVAVILAMLMASLLAMPVVLATYREQRILRRFATTPVRPRTVLLAQYLIYGTAAVVGGAVPILIGFFAYQVALPQNGVGYLGIALLMLASCLALGGLVGGIARTAKIATAFGSILLFPLMFTAGVWLPVQTMPGLLGDLVALTPLGAGALALNATAAGAWPELQEVIVLTAWTAIFGIAAVRFFRWE